MSNPIRLKVPPKIKTVNKLILIGNGLDLALGLKTSYNDFLLWLLKKNVIQAINSGGKQEAPFPKYKGRYDSNFGQYYKKIIFGYSTNNLFDVVLNRGHLIDENKLNELDDLALVFNFFESNNISIINENGIGMFSMMLKNSSYGWVDIEGIYFEFIKEIFKPTSKDFSLEYIDILNQELEWIIEELKLYLSEIKTEVSKSNSQLYLDHFSHPIDGQELLLNDDFKIKTEYNYYLNFNYTNSLKNILSFSKTEHKINHIHGELSDSDGEIIFGFGDEMDKVYKELEEINDNRFFKYIKSFQYFKNENYRDLMRFLNFNEYQVCIYGHSCGLSDRIMLNEIFEHKNCTSIKIYFYKDDLGKTDFTNKTMEISRHFNSNKTMRAKIVNEDPENEIPQLNLGG